MRTKIFAVGKLGTRQQGFTYVMALVAVAVMSILAATASEFQSRRMQVERESELLFRGQAYQRAIRSFYLAGGRKRYPAQLTDLLDDTRFPNRRHLRALYADPFGGEWLLIKAREGGIAGVASSSTGIPIKKAHFPLGLEEFADAGNYREWQFVFSPEPGLPVTKNKLHK